LGRYSLTKRRKDVDREVAARLRVRFEGENEAYGRYNIAPTQEVPAVVQDRHGRRAELLRWGLVPRWARTLNTGLSMINARAETLATSRAYGGLLERGRHRCLVVADGFYEWIAAEDPKQPRLPLRYSLADGASFCFAGLWTTWRAPDGGVVGSCSVITTTANELVAPVHDRMPVVLVDESGWESWLDPALDADAVTTLLAPLPPEALRVARANPVLNSPDHEGPDCLVAPAG
jgi:putative SOS response-associated peptidase YedK